MTLPASGAISLSMIATELGLAATGLNLNDSRVRSLAGKPTGAVSFSDFYGKTYSPPVNYTINFKYDAPSAQYLAGISTVGGGTLSPDDFYRGYRLAAFYVRAASFRLLVGAGMPWVQLTIGSVSLLRSAAAFSTANGYDYYDWAYATGLTYGPYSMTMEG